MNTAHSVHNVLVWISMKEDKNLKKKDIYSFIFFITNAFLTLFSHYIFTLFSHYIFTSGYDALPLLFLHWNSLDVMVNTTHRTIALASVLTNGQENEMPTSSLPGGILKSSTILENQLWLDKEQDPQGAIKWTTKLASYISSRASELALSSSLHHPSFTKVPNFIVAPLKPCCEVLDFVLHTWGQLREAIWRHFMSADFHDFIIYCFDVTPGLGSWKIGNPYK